MSGTAAAIPLYVQLPAGGDAVLSSLDGAQNADNFALSQTVLLDGVEWWGTAADGAIGDFTVRIFGNDDGLPGVDPLATLTGAITATPLSSDIYTYQLVADVVLELAPATYYFAVSNENVADGWYWLMSSFVDDENFFRAADGDPWELYPAPGDFAFGIRGTIKPPVSVPEPGTAALLSIGLAAFWLRSRRRLSVENTNTRR